MKTTIGSSALVALLLTACSSPGAPMPSPAVPSVGSQGPQEMLDLLDCTVDIRPRGPAKKSGFTIEYKWPDRVKKDVLQLWIKPIEQRSSVGVYTTDDRRITTVPANSEVALTLTWNLAAGYVDIVGDETRTDYLYGVRVENGPIHSPAFVQQMEAEHLRVRCFNEGLYTTLVLK